MRWPGENSVWRFAGRGRAPWLAIQIQGRHILPASIGLCGLVLHASRLTRAALLGWLGLMHMMLIHQTVIRYFAGDWSRLWIALP